MAEPPASIDDAFEVLVSAERDAGAAIIAAAADTTATEAHASFEGAISSRVEFFKASSNWVQYAVDDNVLSAICVQLGSFLDSLEVYLASLALPSMPRSSYPCAHLLLPASRLQHFSDFMGAAITFRPKDETVCAVAQQVRLLAMLKRLDLSLLLVVLPSHCQSLRAHCINPIGRRRHIRR